MHHFAGVKNGAYGALEASITSFCGLKNDVIDVIKAQNT